MLNVPDISSDVDISETDAQLVITGTMLCYLTVNISPLNALEFVKAKAVPKLHEIVTYALAKDKPELLTCGLKAFTAILQVRVLVMC